MTWKNVKLKDVCKIVNGSTPSRLRKEYWLKGTIPWFTIDDFRKQGRDINYTYQKVTKLAVNETSLKILPKNTVLLCCTASVGVAAIARINLATNQQFNGLIPNTDELIPEFLYYISSTLTQKLLSLSGSATINFIAISKLKELTISMPTLKEQKQIVDKLDTVFNEIDKKIQINLRKLNNVDKLKDSILDNLIGNNLIKLSDASDLIRRGISPKYLEEGGIAVINQKCIRNHIIDYSKARRHNIKLKKVPEERFIKKGDVLINSTGHGTLGRVAQVNRDPAEKTTVDSHVTIIRPKQKLFDLGYFANALIKIEKQLEAAGEGASGQTELSRSKLESEFDIPYMDSIDKQRKVSLMINSIFENVYILKNSTVKIIENLKSLKLSFLNKEFHNK
jgi:restriction endonuclease S subunit